MALEQPLGMSTVDGIRGTANENGLFRMDELKIFCKVGIVPLTSLSKDSILLLELGCLYQIVTVYSLMEPLSP